MRIFKFHISLISLLTILACVPAEKTDYRSAECWVAPKHKPDLLNLYLVVFDDGDGNTTAQAFSKLCKIDLEKQNPVEFIRFVRVNGYDPKQNEERYFGRMLNNSGLHAPNYPLRVLDVTLIGRLHEINEHQIELSIVKIENISQVSGNPEIIYRNILLGK